MGLVSAWLWQRYHRITLPPYLAFFGGRRFVPIVTGFACLALAAIFGFGWPIVEGGMNSFSRSVLDAGGVGLFAYGVLNRLLLVTGLHHVINNIAWFIVGDFNGVTGDLKRFFAGDPSAGAMMSGFFPVMMFGLPAACLAMYHAAPKANRAKVGGVLLSMALTSFLTGVTEPVEFAFMFLAPVLYLVHAVLTGLSLVLLDAFHVKLGFGFSAGLFDYVLNYGKSTNPGLLIPFGIGYFAVYYGLFRASIAVFDLKTLGREDQAAEADELSSSSGLVAPALTRGAAYLRAIGGVANVRSLDACTTRLRLTVVDSGLVDEAALKAIGARGVLHPGKGNVQVVVGPLADTISAEVHDAMRAATAKAATVETSRDRALAHAMLQALGGASNVRQVDTCTTRLRLSVADASKVDAAAVRGLGARGVVVPAADSVQVIIGPQAEHLASEMRSVLSNTQ